MCKGARKSGEVEDPQLSRRSAASAVNRGPSARNQVKDGKDADQRSSDVDDGLHYIRPNDRRQAAFEGVNKCQDSDDRDGSDLDRSLARFATTIETAYTRTPSASGARNRNSPAVNDRKRSSETALDQLVRGDRGHLENNAAGA